MQPSGDERLERALDKALRDQKVHVAFRDWIRRLVFEQGDDWRVCCGNNCMPCVLPMARAVDQVRAEIGWEAEEAGHAG
ncbi:MAG: hypothetical protein R3F30_10975 [Planctomycetota bacterium]